MSLPLVAFRLGDNVQEFCYIITDILRINEMFTFCSSQVKSVQTYLFEKCGYLSDRNMIGEQEDAANENMERVSFNHHIQIFSTPQFSNCRSMQKGSLREKPCIKSGKSKSKPKSSTPQQCNKESTNVTQSSEEVIDLQYRLFSLEQEVSRLRKQIETLIKTSEPCSHEGSYSLPPIQEVMEPYVPPPPPPPPPPVSKQIPLVFKKKSCKPLAEYNVKYVPEKLDMAAVLKGLKDVKLKPTDRSPGGTPMRKTKPLSNNASDILQEALKRRFKSIHQVDNYNKENVTDSWENSPSRSFISGDELLNNSFKFWDSSN